MFADVPDYADDVPDDAADAAGAADADDAPTGKDGDTTLGSSIATGTLGSSRRALPLCKMLLLY